MLARNDYIYLTDSITDKLPEFSIVNSGTKTVAAGRAGNDFISHTNSFNDKLNC